MLEPKEPTPRLTISIEAKSTFAANHGARWASVYPPAGEASS
jgi:hypothetical protein